MLMKRIISTFLVVLMLVSSMSLVIGAEDGGSETAPVYEYNTNKNTPTMDYSEGYMLDEEGESTGEKVDTQEEKLALMDLRVEQDGYRLYVDAFSGEVAVENIETGDVLFTNPYDVSSKSIQEDKKAEMLSQFLISFVDTSNNDTSKEYNSYKDAVKGGDYDSVTASQIDVKYIKNGLRVEYSIGRIDSRYLVPERISKEKFENEILNVVKEAVGEDHYEYKIIYNFFELKDVDAYIQNFKDPVKAQEQKEEFLKRFPMCEDGPVYAFTGAVKKEYKSVESVIKKYCPDYTYEDLDEEHLALNYVPAEKTEALFTIALEYTLDETGLTVRVPANGIRFDESVFRLESIQILPYMGAGRNPNAGYTFFPDGSGALFDFEELAKITGETYFHGTIYGDDFAYYNIGTTAPHNEPVTYPVFGLVEDVPDDEGNVTSRGFLAIVEDGEAMMKLSSYHEANYNTVRMQVSPRPYDEYKLSDAISVAGDAPFVVVSPRKYTGDFKIKYLMLTDPDVKTGNGYYDTSYVGMAKAYREYLVSNGVLTKLTNEDLKDDIPLYIETFGAIETVEKFLSIPYDAMKALTSFDDIRKMYDQLKKSGVTNINFILTGYGKGGMTNDQIPYKLKWDKVVEEDMTFEELLAYAKKEGFGLYPDFDFAFVADNKMFDGLSLMDHAVRTIDDRYTSKREYSATRQTYVSYFELAISPAYFSRFYEKLTETYGEYEPIGISVSTLGTYLNSDFDEDEPYHREDSKDFTEEAFAYFDKHYDKVMTSGGNAYTWKYIDHITDISTDSSRHARSAATVPFLGMVLHGYVQTAGSPVNMEGNIDYAMLRAIENGSALQFILSYQNTEKLKENQSTSIYYSVRYDIWVNDLVERYNEINEALKDVQTSTIDAHTFVEGVRIPNDDEIAKDSSDELFNAISKEIADAAANREELRVTLQNVRKYLLAWEKYSVADNAESAAALYADKAVKLAALEAAKDAVAAAEAAVKAAEEALEAATKEPTEESTEESTPETAEATNEETPSEETPNEETTEPTPEEIKKALEDALAAAKEANDKALADMKAAYDEYKAVSAKAVEVADEYIAKYEFARDNFDKLAENDAYTENIIAELKAILDGNKTSYDALVVLAEVMKNEAESAVVTELEEKYAELLGVGAQDEEKEEDDDDLESTVYNKYAAATNSIVYERYSNGKAFVLNFNNYAVKVQIDGVYYSIDAYGYIIL